MGHAPGAVFVILGVIRAFLAGSPPKVSDSDEKINSSCSDNQAALKSSVYLAGLGLVFFLFFLGIVWTRLHRAEGGPGRLAGTSAMAGVAAITMAGAGFGIDTYGYLHPAESVVTYRLSTVVFGMLAFAALVFVEAASIVIIRTKFLPGVARLAGDAHALLWLVGGRGRRDRGRHDLRVRLRRVPRLGAVDPDLQRVAVPHLGQHCS